MVRDWESRSPPRELPGAVGARNPPSAARSPAGCTFLRPRNTRSGAPADGRPRCARSNPAWGRDPGYDRGTSTAITDSLSSSSLPARCCSTTKRRNRDSRWLRENLGLASIFPVAAARLLPLIPPIQVKDGAGADGVCCQARSSLLPAFSGIPGLLGSVAQTIQKHVDNLWLLGGEIIRDLNEDPSLRKLPVERLLHDAVDADGGPLSHNGSEQEQRSFDSTCRSLHRFLTHTGHRARASRRFAAGDKRYILLVQCNNVRRRSLRVSSRPAARGKGLRSGASRRGSAIPTMTRRSPPDFQDEAKNIFPLMVQMA